MGEGSYPHVLEPILKVPVVSQLLTVQIHCTQTTHSCKEWIEKALSRWWQTEGIIDIKAFSCAEQAGFYLLFAFSPESSDNEQFKNLLETELNQLRTENQLKSYEISERLCELIE